MFSSAYHDLGMLLVRAHHQGTVVLVRLGSVVVVDKRLKLNKISLTSKPTEESACLASPVSGRTAAEGIRSRNLFLLLKPLPLLKQQNCPNKVTFNSQIVRTFSSSSISLFNKMTTTNGSLARQNYHEECEGHMNRQINMELYASYVYLSMAYYFDRDDVAFPGLHKFFKKQSDEEREHAQKFMEYQNLRGGRIILQPIAKPSNDEWNSPLEAIQAALELEKSVNANLLKIHSVASAHNDPQICDFLETNFLEEQVKSSKELADYIVQLKRCGPGLGEFLFDKELEKELSS